MSRYNSVVKNLYQVNKWHPVKLGLENSEALYRLLGSPLASKPVFHIAGTNGKGSVAWKISKALRAAGYRDGLFVSPHVSSFRERIQIRGKMISEEDVVVAVPMIVDLCEEHKLPATFFELTTALAFHHFRNTDAVALEVGLGGRLDATNVVTPTVSIITSIGLDHTRILGDTVEEIAMEKAGIMKPGVPVSPNSAVGFFC
jgi:dihydrofolate synthase/folylpolyglutamate synthase